MRAPVILALAFALLAPACTAADAPDLALTRGLAYLAVQSANGASEYMAEAVIGAGEDPGLWPTPQVNLLDRLAIPAVGTPGNDPIREIHAVAQSGYNPRHFQGRDLVSDLKAAWERSNQGVGQATFTLLALHAAGVPATDATYQDTLSLLQTGQSADGGWACIGLSSPDCTGFALTALRAANGFQPHMQERAKLWLDGARQPNGGYGNGGLVGGDPFNILGIASPTPDLAKSNPQSTIWAVHGYRALNQPVPAEIWTYLRSRQMPDGGFAKADGESVSNQWATTEVIAGWTRSFHDLPTYADTHIVAPASIEAGVPAAFALADADLSATWSILPAAGVTGNPAQLTFPVPGAALLHAEGRGAGTHHREKLTVQVDNGGPLFLNVPDRLVVDRITPLRLDVKASDAVDGPVEVEWRFLNVTGRDAVDVQATQLGTFPLELRSQDSDGVATTASVQVEVRNLAPSLDAVDLPTQATADVPFQFAAIAHDPDGSTPNVRWQIGAIFVDAANGTMALPAGMHLARIVATDSDGANTTLQRTLRVQVPPLPSLEVPQIDAAIQDAGPESPTAEVPEPGPDLVGVPGDVAEAFGEGAAIEASAVDAKDAPGLEAGLLAFALIAVALRRRQH